MSSSSAPPPPSPPPKRGRSSSHSSFSEIYQTTTTTSPQADRPASSKRAAEDGTGHGTAPKKQKQSTEEREPRGASPVVSLASNSNNLSELLHGETCQSCDKVSPPTLRIAWQLGVRMCRECLVNNTQSENDLMFSDYSGLLKAAPFTFLTKDNRLVSNAEFKHYTTVASEDSIRKVYLTSTLESLKSQLEGAQQSSNADAAKLFAEMQENRNTLRATAEKWEEWEQNRGPASSKSDQSDKRPPSTVIKQDSVDNTSDTFYEIHAPAPVRWSAIPHQSPETDDGASSAARASSNDIETLKEGRKFDIIRRCNGLDPPITPSLLECMDSFWASLQIPQTLTEAQWNVLKPRLLREKPAAQKKRKYGSVSAGSEQTSKSSNPSRLTAKDLPEHRSQEVQEELRQQLADHADAIVDTNWQAGQSVSYQSAPRFAAQVLSEVRGRYYMNSGDEIEKLTLGDMKWVYDHKIKAIAEAWRKDLFLCNGCADKYRGFDSVNQHYAAKHPNDFGVQWQVAEWLVDPPFALDPDSRIPTGFKTPTNAGSRQHHTVPPPAVPGVPWTANYQQYGVTTPIPGYAGMSYSPNPFAHQPYPMNAMGQFPPPPPQYPMSTLGHGSPPIANHTSYAPPPYPMHMGHTSPAPSPYHPNAWHPPPGPAYPAVPYPNPMLHGPLLGAAPPQHPQHGSSLYAQHTEELAAIANHIWSSIGKIKELPESVKAHTVIYHVAHTFQERCSIEPSIELFHSCLSQSPSLAPLRDLSSLACKACVLKDERSSSTHSNSHVEYPSGGRKIYNLSSLISHFKAVHSNRPPALKDAQNPSTELRGDWKTDMVECPPRKFMEALKPKLDSSKFPLIAGAFPHIFRMHISTMTESRGMDDAKPPETHDNPREVDAVDDPMDMSGHVRTPTPRNRAGLSSSPPAAADHEYDPRRPAITSPDQSQNWPQVGRADIQVYSREEGEQHGSAASRNAKPYPDDAYQNRTNKGDRRRFPSHAPELNKWNKPPSHQVQPSPRSGDSNVIVVKGHTKPSQSVQSTNTGDYDFALAEGDRGEPDYVHGQHYPERQHRVVYEAAMPEELPEEGALFWSKKQQQYYRRLSDGKLEPVEFDEITHE